MKHDLTLIPLTEATDTQGGGGCGCGCSGHADTGITNSDSTATTAEEPAMGSQTFAVEGMTCGHCVHAVTEEIQALPGVTDVRIDLVAGGTSTVTVTANPPLAAASVAAALDEAGDYHLAT